MLLIKTRSCRGFLMPGIPVSVGDSLALFLGVHQCIGP